MIRSETFVTPVSEMVRATDLAAASELLAVPAGDLATIALDRALVIPAPPGDDG